MPFGLTPYDKKVYKKHRKSFGRNDVLLYSEEDIRRKRRNKRIVLVVVIVLAVAAIAIPLWNLFSSSTLFSNTNQDNTVDNSKLLVIVNRQKELLQSYEPKLENTSGIEVSELIGDNLEKMIENAKKDSVSLKIKYGYIDYKTQQSMFETELKKYLENPEYTQVRAEAKARSIVPQGGQSEAQTGLQIEFESLSVSQKAWLERNAVKYGFVLRYQNSKQTITGRQGSDTIYRYVGKNNSEIMLSYDMCLEEYFNYLSNREEMAK